MSKPKKIRTVCATAAVLALTAGLAGAADAGSDEDAGRPAEHSAGGASSSDLAWDELLTRLRDAGYSDIREIEREREKYEVKGRNSEGYRVELYVDARTGEIIKEERDD